MTEEESKKAELLYENLNNNINIINMGDYKYYDLACIKWKYCADYFISTKDKVCKYNVSKLMKKKKIKIAFLIPMASTWSCETLYQLLRQDDRYEVYIVVHAFFNGTEETVKEEYYRTLNYFIEKNYSVIDSYDFSNNRSLDWNGIGKPDIVFHLNPHYKCFPEKLWIHNFPLSTLHIYVPYGIMTYGATKNQYNQMSHLLYWKIFCESEIHKFMAKIYSDISDSNVINSGYIKMDKFYSKTQNKKNIWKIPEEKSEEDVIKIIYAPHHSIGNNLCAFSTFDHNYMKFYDYAKNNSNTSWVFKPHPILKKASIEYGIFSNEEEYEKYLEKWDMLPNARVANEGEYIDLFKSSDTMILDSVSFLSEYLYTGKPYLFITREGQTFNFFGQELYKILYTAEQEKFEDVDKFINDVVINKNDFKKELRITFFRKYLDYLNINKKLAGEFVYEYICNNFNLIEKLK
ncbi:hypothetical protein [Anaeromicropila herbilytica]|uniref:CDP-Glycerol:Poly(Glycerophosphate) glycerophosphotransferase n=1 Tax=Anaeromicropila herbilytica TaxID=2785025 RepID=A0A7R7IEY4_9FIRM|nr:hypothetical protein [Anaeromicropila herbilytica]BCN32526.1 hypothetical protein bsdtb5_38210 [Anaeromicropila herbilytica]